MLTHSISINNAVPNTLGGFERCVGVLGVLGDVEEYGKRLSGIIPLGLLM
ncbi:hypothetical protein [Desulfosporosinus fructosivorans]